MFNEPFYPVLLLRLHTVAVPTNQNENETSRPK